MMNIKNKKTLMLGVILGVVLLLGASSYFAFGAKDKVFDSRGNIVTISDCRMNPSEIKLEATDFQMSDSGQNSAKIVFKNSDNNPHNLGVSGSQGKITISANGTQEIPVSAGSEAGMMTITCDGKESLRVSFASGKEIVNQDNTNYASGEFNMLPGGIKDCAKKILGSDNLSKLFTGNLSVSPDEQSKLSLCFYNTLASEKKKCVSDLVGGEQNLEMFFKNIPDNGDVMVNTAKCMGIERYNSLLVIQHAK